MKSITAVNFFLLVVDKEQGPRCLENLERLHFAEDLEITDVSSDFHFMSFQGKFLHKDALEKIFGKLPRRGEVLGVEEALIGFVSDFTPNVPGYHFFIKTADLEEIKAKLLDSPMRSLSFGALEFGFAWKAAILPLEKILPTKI